ncbi:ABC transporter ATP-binding protein [Coprococcus catus]|uniref:ABC transporter ATP-binding protein n=1 Tax=Coprococcus catus TaxID=116085 RepID=UPI001C8B1B82|nr:ABC transporter ATP-binding protein [Coprococcus catus]MBX9231687.1 ABC transporter ATP-binding protein [Coprococcus catus]MCT6801195.1 ABC transporter ATP-binding protein [Coprococcus catus]
MRLMLSYLKRYKGLVFLNFISVFGFALTELGIPTIISKMVDGGVASGDREYLMKMGGLIAVISIVGILGTVVLGYCGARISTAVTCDIRNDLFEKVQSFSHREMNQLGVSSLITRTSNDALQIMNFMNIILRTAMLTPVMIVISFTLIIMSSVRLSLVIAATVPFIILGVVLVAKISGPISERQQTALDGLNRIFRENLTGIRVIRSFNNDARETERFGEQNQEFTNQSRKLFTLMSSTEPLFFLLMNIAAISIYFIASQMINQSTLQVGQLMAFMEYLFHAMFSVMLFCLVFMMYPRANISAKRIEVVMNMTPDIQDEISEEKTVSDIGEHIEEVVFDHVDFCYPDGEEAVLKDISFTAKAGETLAIIGSTGSGKSTLIQLIPRFYDVTGGRVLINGVDVRQMNSHELREHIGFVAQKANLFSGTIEENIRFGREDATDEEVRHAAEIAQAMDFIMDKPNGFQEKIVEGAGNLSGGQKQRLSITRALVRKPDIYIYDDSFSALDMKTDALLRQALKSEVKNAVVIIVAQRVSTIMDADQILVLDEGRLAAVGRHKELLKECPLYYEIAASQLSEEELQNVR